MDPHSPFLKGAAAAAFSERGDKSSAAPARSFGSDSDTDTPVARPTVGKKVPRQSARPTNGATRLESESESSAGDGSDDESAGANDRFSDAASSDSEFAAPRRPPARPKASAASRSKNRSLDDDMDFSDASFDSESEESYVSSALDSESSVGSAAFSENSDSDFEFRPSRARKPRPPKAARGAAADRFVSSFVNRKKASKGQPWEVTDDEGGDDLSGGSDYGKHIRRRSPTGFVDEEGGRSSTRRGAATVKTYNERELYDFGSDAASEEESDGPGGTPRNVGTPMGRSASESGGKLVPLISEPSLEAEDVVESLHDYRRRADRPAEVDDGDAEFSIDNYELLVKWQNWAHIYDTWETSAYLSEVKGFKKVTNYVKAVVEAAFDLRHDPDTTAEDLEQTNIQREIDRDNMAQFAVVDRVIACREARLSVAERRELEPGSRNPVPRYAFPEAHPDTEKTGENANGDADADDSHPMEYLVKWGGLPYKETTWEPAARLLALDAQDAIDEYYDRLRSETLPHRGEHYHGRNALRPKFHPLHKQPTYLAGGDLRDYQLNALNWMASLWARNENGILADEMGLGKTIQTIAFISYLFHSQHVYGPHLVVVPLSTVMAWEREFKKWSPDINVLCYMGDNRSRQALRAFEFYVPATDAGGRPRYPDSRFAPPAAAELATIRARQPQLLFNVVLTTYELILKDADILGDIRWAFLAVDEAHRLKNAQSLLATTLRNFSITNRLLVTGTPLSNVPSELFNLLHFLMPEKFTERELALFDFQVNDADPEKIRDLHTRLRPYMLRRLKKEVEKSLPQKIERVLRVEMAPLQEHYTRLITTRNYQALNRGAGGGSHTSLINIMMELKKAANHPYLFPGAEPTGQTQAEQLRGLVRSSGKMVLLDSLLTRLRAGGHRVLIFSQMVRLLDILSDYLVLRNYPHQRLDGSVASEARKKAIDQFNAPGSLDFVFLLSTRAGGLGINLTAADTVIIFDSDWNPQNDLQAMARAHRIGQTKTVNVYRFISKESMEEGMFERAKRKMVLEYCIIKRMDTSGSGVLAGGRGLNGAAKAALKELAGDGADRLAAMVPSGSGNQFFNKDELSAILKFGAANVFKESDNEKKLDDLDLDDILARAEHHDTAAAPDAEVLGLQGEDFLSQFQVADYAADQDWDDIIPEAERQRAADEAESERLREEQELYWSSRRRRKVVSYAEDGARVATAASAAAGGGSGDASGAVSTSRRGRGAAGGGDPSVFSERDIRALYRAVLKFGDLRVRYETVTEEGDLADKDRASLERVYDDLIAACEKAASGSGTAGKGNDPAGSDGDEAADEDGGDRKTTKSNTITFRGVTGINASQVLQRVAELGCLAAQVAPCDPVTRFRFTATLKPVHNWACTWGQKDDSLLLVGIYKYGFGNWERMREDPALGFTTKFFIGPNAAASGSVQAPPPPPASSKSRPKASRAAAAARTIDAPKGTHLARRGEYLLKALQTQAAAAAKRAKSSSSAKSAAGGSKRSRSKAAAAPEPKRARTTKSGSRSSSSRRAATRRRSDSGVDDDDGEVSGNGGAESGDDDLYGSPTASGTTQRRRRTKTETGGDDTDDFSPRRPKAASRTATSTKTRSTRTSGRATASSSARGKSSAAADDSAGGSAYLHYDSMDDDDCKEQMRGVKHELKRIRKEDPSASAEDKLRTIRECIKTIGSHIDACVRDTTRRVDHEAGQRQHRHLWAFTTYFWPRPVSPEKLQSIYNKMAE
ncbi:ATP-dependent DNA helicase Hrp3 [Tieghemiomyces parasiticus]|uniref:ATP-dependent DNA helicase Hrp3 n=1 Tax=Tieghemiomyces parasiticus TaxID=78921 RepID=A0A9W8DRU3_9FUNG|nr:ATP-dependent DNA helicase Hrp3 [Tieghemiomyces parasiticus]